MKKLSVYNILIVVSLVIIIYHGVSQILNNGLNLKYLIEPFEVGSDILELKLISNEIVENNSQTIMMLLALKNTILIFHIGN